MEKSVFMEQLIKYLEVTDRQTVRTIGHGASGKSCLAAALVAALGERVNLLETDT